jgi:hypothetical protein
VSAGFSIFKIFFKIFFLTVFFFFSKKIKNIYANQGRPGAGQRAAGAGPARGAERSRRREQPRIDAPVAGGQGVAPRA